MLVHLAPERIISAIRRGGIARAKDRLGVYAMPVTPNFIVSHQWLRELKRGGASNFHGVYFRIPDDEPVLYGHYGMKPLELTAARAVGEFMRAADPLGLEIIVPRRVTAREIHRICRLPQNLGWRYSPQERARLFCACI